MLKASFLRLQKTQPHVHPSNKERHKLASPMASGVPGAPVPAQSPSSRAVSLVPTRCPRSGWRKPEPTSSSQEKKLQDESRGSRPRGWERASSTSWVKWGRGVRAWTALGVVEAGDSPRAAACPLVPGRRPSGPRGLGGRRAPRAACPLAPGVQGQQDTGTRLPGCASRQTDRETAAATGAAPAPWAPRPPSSRRASRPRTGRPWP